MIADAVRLLKKPWTYWRIRRDPVGYARSIGVRVGQECWLILQPETFGASPYLVTLGNRVLITAGVRFVTHDGGVWVFREQHPGIDRIAPITVGNNVFIGVNSIILPGVTIGNNCVIGAGSVVTRDIPADSVAAGVPARRIKSVDEYWRKIEPELLDIATLPPQEKLAFIKWHFDRE